ncbi:hypothetical protein BASA81_005540 [Batrachochytrium salamandrivorans]|nr:hypothetical protein BASA81_005540 [Batrachochytrium salamandrivorans]
MKLLVGVKRVVDFSVKVRVETKAVKFSMNPFCEIAMEEAVRMREKGHAKEIVAVSVGPKASTDTLRAALASGADRAIHILVPETTRMDLDFQPLAVAKVLAKVVAKEQPGLVLLGKQSIDGDNNQTGQLLAGLLDWPQATYASKIEFTENSANVTREIDGGLQTINVALPAVITTDLRLNEPRYPALPAIMKAKKKPLEVIELAKLDAGDLAPRITIVSVEEPPKRQGGAKVASVDELVQKLKSTGVLG